MRLSIVIPVYNVELYIRKCIESVLCLPFSKSDYEIIVVNDGTPDNSMDIVKEYESYSNIHIISQENKGLGGARNTGLRSAKGEWVYFLDSDDSIDYHSFITLFQKACDDESVDIIIGDYDYVLNNERVRGKFTIETKDDIVLPGEVFLERYYSTVNTMVWRSIYRKKMLLDNNLYFIEGVYHEDVNWTPKCIIKANNIYYSPISFYYYLIREGSIIQSAKNTKKVNDLLVAYEDLLRYFSNCSKNAQRSISNSAITSLLVLNGQYAFYKDKDINARFLEVISTRCSRSLRIKIICGLYRLFPSFFNHLLSNKYGNKDTKAIF